MTESNEPERQSDSGETCEQETCACGEPLTIIEEQERGECVYCAYDYHNTDNPQRCHCDMCIEVQP